MTAEQREFVRAKVDELTRVRVQVEDALFGPGCAGCGMSMTNWTPGCKRCWERHRNWRRKGSDMYDELLHRAVLRFSEKRMSHEDSPKVAASLRRNMLKAQAAGGTWKAHREALGVAS